MDRKSFGKRGATHLKKKRLVNSMETQKAMLHEIESVKKDMVTLKSQVNSITDKFSDRMLSKDDKKALDAAIKAYKNKKLKSFNDVFG